MIEKWKPFPVKPFEKAYEISNYGNLRSIDRYIYCARKKGPYTIFMAGKPIHRKPNKKGYIVTKFVYEGFSKMLAIHYLVMLAFGPPCPGKYGQGKGKYEVNHKDTNKANNHIENLEWCTSSENAKHSFKFGKRTNKNENHTQCKLTNDQVKQIRELYKQGIPQVKLAKQFDVSQAHISSIVLFKYRNHL